MNDHLTTVAHHLIFNGGKNGLPYFRYDVLHDCICSKWIFECRGPMYEGRFEGFAPLAGVGCTCCSTRKGKGGKRVLLLFHATAMGTRRLIEGNRFDNFYSSCGRLLKKIMGQTAKLDGLCCLPFLEQ